MPRHPGKRHGSHENKFALVMREFAAGTLHSGRGGPIVTSRKQAQAIAASETRRAKRKHRRK